MPVVKQFEVMARDDYRRGLRVGDVIVGVGTVEDVRDGRDNVIVKVKPLDPKRVTRERKYPLMDPITVEREVPTEAEEFDRKVADVVEEGTKYQTRAHKAVYSRFTKLVGTFADKDAKGYLYPFDIDEAMSLEVAQRADAIWRQVGALVEDYAAGGANEGEAWVRAIAATRFDVSKSLTSRYTNALSRSSSVTSNLVDDITRQVNAEFLDDTKYLYTEVLYAAMQKEDN